MIDPAATSAPAATDTAAPQTPAAPPEAVAASPSALPARPDGLPDKFWDDGSASVRLDQLVRSYTELERHLGEARPAAPQSADAYEIKVASESLAVDADVNTRLHAAGFSNEQAQLVYDLAAERLMPALEEAQGELEHQRHLDRLAGHFGGPDQWQAVSPQIAHWGRARFPSDVFSALSSTADGVLAMHALMTSGEPALSGTGGESAAGPASEQSLRTLMRDPKYWRDRDPALVERVRSGFRNLYSERG